MSEPLEVRIVGPVMTNVPDPWRTQGDYRQDQKRQLHLYIFQAITLVVAVAGLVVSSWFQYQASKQPPQKVHCIAQHPADNAASPQNTIRSEKTAKTQSKQQQQKPKSVQ